MTIRRELESSDVACETLDVRASLTVAGVAVVPGPPTPPAPTAPHTRSTFLQDFVNDAGVLFTVDVAPASGNMTTQISARAVGIAQISAGGNGGGITLKFNALTNTFSQVGFGVLTLEWVCQLPALAPTAVADATYRLFASTLQQSGFGNGNCLGFTMGFAENGVANWFAVLNDATKFNTGVPYNFVGHHRYTIVHDPSIPRVQWFIDGVLTNTFNGVPSVNGLSVTMSANLKSITQGNSPEIRCDYMYWDYVYNRFVPPQP